MTTPLEEIVSGLREAAEKVTEAVEAHWGERCPNFDADCACCQAWAELDAFQAQAARIGELTAERDGLKASYSETLNSEEQWITRAETAERGLAAAVEERDALKADKERLDFLDRLNIGLNDRYGTSYRWKMVVNHNVNRLYLRDINTIDINDAQANGLQSCREAIDEQMRAAKGTAK